MTRTSCSPKSLRTRKLINLMVNNVWYYLAQDDIKFQSSLFSDSYGWTKIAKFITRMYVCICEDCIQTSQRSVPMGTAGCSLQFLQDTRFCLLKRTSRIHPWNCRAEWVTRERYCFRIDYRSERNTIGQAKEMGCYLENYVPCRQLKPQTSFWKLEITSLSYSSNGLAYLPAFRVWDPRKLSRTWRFSQCNSYRTFF